MTKEELIQAIRLDIAGELGLFTFMMLTCKQSMMNSLKVLGDIRDEEKAHVGEL